MEKKNETVIYRCGEKIKYRGHAIYGAIIEEDFFGNERHWFYSDNPLKNIMGGCGFQWFPHVDGLVVFDKKSLRLNDVTLAKQLNGESTFFRNNLCRVNIDGSIFFKCLTQNASIPVDNYLFVRANDRNDHMIPCIINKIPAPVKAHNGLLSIHWAARHPSGGFVTFYLEKDSLRSGSFYLNDELMNTFPTNALTTQSNFGVSRRGLITTIGTLVYVDRHLEHNSNWTEIKICPAGFITQENGKLILNGRHAIPTEDFIDWDVCFGTNDVVVQRRTSIGYELIRISVDA